MYKLLKLSPCKTKRGGLQSWTDTSCSVLSWNPSSTQF